MSDGDILNPSWAWSLPLIVLTVILHVTCLGVINTWVVRALHGVHSRRNFFTVFALVMGFTTLLATLLHAAEGAVWALAYRWLGALPSFSSAMVYSLSAMTAYGHANIFLEKHWQLMGALEALNGLLLFGFTTAFLFSHIQRVWETQDKRGTGPRNP
jgi:hypothetical protein